MRSFGCSPSKGRKGALEKLFLQRLDDVVLHAAAAQCREIEFRGHLSESLPPRDLPASPGARWSVVGSIARELIAL